MTRCVILKHRPPGSNFALLNGTAAEKPVKTRQISLMLWERFAQARKVLIHKSPRLSYFFSTIKASEDGNIAWTTKAVSRRKGTPNGQHGERNVTSQENGKPTD